MALTSNKVGTLRRPRRGETFQLGGEIGFFHLVEGARGAADDALLAFPDLSEDCAETCGQRVRIQPERQAEVGEGGGGDGVEESLEAVQGVLTVQAPKEDRVLPGQGMQLSGDGCEIFYVTPVVPGETQKGADFRGVFGRADLPDGGEQRGVR